MSNIFTEQPWIADTGPIAPALSGAEIALNSRRSALKVLLSVVSIFFMLMIVAYGGRMLYQDCLLYTSPSPRDLSTSRMPSSA